MIQKHDILFLKKIVFVKVKKYIDNSIKNRTFVGERVLIFN